MSGDDPFLELAVIVVVVVACVGFLACIHAIY